MNKQQFNSWVHKYCIISGLILLFMMLGFPLAVSMVYGVWPNWAQIIPGIVSLFFILAPWWPAECLGYMSTMGPGALYLSYITGNVTNLRMPATVGTINALDIAPNTDECHTMAIIACAASNYTTIAIIAIGVVLAAPLKPLLTSPALQPAYNMALPALFGGLTAQTIFTKSKKEWGLWFVVLAFSLFLTFFMKIPSAYVMLIATFAGAAVWYLGVYKSAGKKEK